MSLEIMAVSIFGKPRAARKFGPVIEIPFSKNFCSLNIQLKNANRSTCVSLLGKYPFKRLWNNNISLDARAEF